MGTRMKFSRSEMKELEKILGEIFANKRNITSSSSRMGGEQEFVLRSEELARQIYPECKDAVLIKGSAAYACQLAGIKARVANVGDIAEIALTRSRKDAYRLRLVRVHGCAKPYKQRTLGLNFMLDEVNAAVVATLLKREIGKKVRERRI